MRILALLPDYPPAHRGGWEWGAFQVNEEWARQGHVVSVLTSVSASHCEEISVRQRVERLMPTPLPDCARNDLSIGERFRRRRVANAVAHCLASALDRTKPDFVMIWILATYPSVILTECERRGIPYLLYISNYGFPRQLLPAIHLTARIKRGIGRWWIKAGTVHWSHVNWSRVVYCSEYVKRHYAVAGDAALAGTVIHWGVDSRRFKRSPEKANHPVRLLWAGRISSEKGLHVALDAMRLLPADSATLEIYGPVDDQCYFEAHVVPRLSGTVRYRGFLKKGELGGRMAESDVFVFTSIWPEPFSVVLLEAIAAGLAIVATDTGGTREAVSEEHAILVPPNDSVSLAHGIMRLLRAPSTIITMKEAARSRVRQFSISAMADSLLSTAGVVESKK